MADTTDPEHAEPPLREIRPVTSDDVPGALRAALDQAVDGTLRGVVILMTHHGTQRLTYATGGHWNIAEIGLLIDRLKFDHFCDQRGGVP